MSGAPGKGGCDGGGVRVPLTNSRATNAQDSWIPASAGMTMPAFGPSFPCTRESKRPKPNTNAGGGGRAGGSDPTIAVPLGIVVRAASVGVPKVTDEDSP